MSNDTFASDLLLDSSAYPAVGERELFRTAVEVLDRNRWGLLCVVDRDGRLAGVLTDGDLRRLLLHDRGPLPMRFSQPVGRLIQRDPVTVEPDTSALECLTLMNERLIGCLPVVDEQRRYLGIISWQHVVRAMLREEPTFAGPA